MHSITNVWVSSEKAPSEGSFAATRPIATGARIAAAIRPISDSVLTRALCCVSTGFSRNTRPKAK